MDKLTTLSKRSLPLRHARRTDVASQSLLWTNSQPRLSKRVI
nr:MAG TPA: hypothetical protein [Inoviridae sp.]